LSQLRSFQSNIQHKQLSKQENRRMSKLLQPLLEHQDLLKEC